jgi:glucose/arabinose dehydrogenase
MKPSSKQLLFFAGFFLSSIAFAIGVKAQTPILFYNPVAGGLSEPLDIVNAGDGTNRLFIVERGGKIKILSGGVIQPVPFLDLTGSSLISLSGGERGLLSMAFHPDYENNGYFFIYYTRYNADPALDGDLQVSRFHVSSNANLADISSRQDVITIAHHTYTNHNGGKLNFGPDSSLYFATGDGGDANDPDNNAQNLQSLLGKMIRILVNDSSNAAPFYTAPLDNPYASEPTALKEIFSIGLRNPFRWSFDQNGATAWNMWIGDVGQNVYEEIDFRAAGNQKSNFGWRCYEGNIPTPGVPACTPADTVNPVYQYDHGTSGGRAVTGGIVYRGSTYPYMQGWYNAIDFYTGNSWLIKADRSQPARLQSGLPTGIAALGEDEARELYAVSLTQGQVYQVQAIGIVPIKLLSFTAVEKNGSHLINWKTSMEENMDHFELAFSTTGSIFKTIHQTIASNNRNGNEYSYVHPITESRDMYYRLAMIDKDGKIEYSKILHLNSRDAVVSVIPTVVRNRTITIKTNTAFNRLEVIDINGKTRMIRNQKLMPGNTVIQLPALSRGMYIIKLINGEGMVNRRVIVE